MKLAAGWFLVAMLIAPQSPWAQLQPHRAEYSLRLGTALNAPRIGTLMQEITLDCTTWHIERDISVEIPLTPSLKIGVTSRLSGTETHEGDSFKYRAVRIQEGVERKIRAEVQQKDGTIQVDIATSDGPQLLTLPPRTLMPISGIRHLVTLLNEGATSFSFRILGAEEAGAVLSVDVKRVDISVFPPRPRTVKPMELPSGEAWSVQMTVSRADPEAAKPSLSIRATILGSGVIERLLVDTDMITLAAYLQAVEMREATPCAVQ